MDARGGLEESMVLAVLNDMEDGGSLWPPWVCTVVESQRVRVRVFWIRAWSTDDDVVVAATRRPALLLYYWSKQTLGAFQRSNVQSLPIGVPM